MGATLLQLGRAEEAAACYARALREVWAPFAQRHGAQVCGDLTQCVSTDSGVCGHPTPGVLTQWAACYAIAVEEVWAPFA
jgi:hypothetical protein